MKTVSFTNVHYMLIHAAFWVTFCTGTGYLSSCLLSVGFANSQVGIIIALCGFGSVLAQSTLSGVIDRSGERLLKPVILAAVLSAVVLSAVELVFPESMAVIGICYGLNIVAMMFLVPLVSSMSVCAAGGKVNFGLGRATGSIVYAVSAILVGRAVTACGMSVLPIVRIAAFGAFLICAMSFPVQVLPIVQKKEKQKKAGFFKRNPGFEIIMVGCVLSYFCQTLTSYFGYQIVESKGGDNAALGMALALCAFVEVPVMIGFTKLLKLRGASFWFVMSGFGYAVKALAYCLAPNIPLYYVAQLAQFAGWPLMQVACVKYVSSVTIPEDTTRGQAYVNLTYSMSMMVGAPIGGFILQYLNVSAMLLIAMCSSLAGGTFILLGVRKRRASLPA